MCSSVCSGEWRRIPFYKRHRPLPLSLVFECSEACAHSYPTSQQHECRAIEMKSDVFGHFTAQIKFSHISVISFALQKLLTVRISQNLFEHLIKPAQFWVIFNWNTISTQQHIYNSTDSEFWKDGVISTLRRFARINGRGSIFRFRFVIWRSLMNPSKQERFYN